MKQQEIAIAENLKGIREKRGLSLDRLAELTGVSKSMLRQIETGRSSPTIATLWKIANGLRISFTNLLSRRSSEVTVMDVTSPEPLTAHEGRYRVFPLMPFDPKHAFEIYHQEIEPGTRYDGEPHRGDTEEYVFVDHGCLELKVDGASHKVEAGQFIRFAADRPHSYFAAGDEMVSAIMLICYLS
jgi:transcriptional regulator with XRE-family HTH domain